MTTVNSKRMHRNRHNSGGLNNKPISARKVYRKYGGTVWTLLPDGVYSPWMDMAGPNGYVLDSLNPPEIIKIIKRFNSGILAVEGDFSMTDVQIGMNYCCFTCPIESEEFTKQQLLNGNKLMQSIKLMAHKEKKNIKEWLKQECKKGGGVSTITRMRQGYVCDVADPKVCYKCCNCKEIFAVDTLTASSEEINAYYKSMEERDDEKAKRILKRRGLDINYMKSNYLKNIVSKLYPDAAFFKHSQVDSQGDTLTCPFCNTNINLCEVKVEFSALDKFEDTRWVDGTNLTEMLSMRYGDFYDDLEPKTRQELLLGDYKIVKKALREHQSKYVNMPANLSKMDYRLLKEFYGGIAAGHITNEVSLNPLLNVELKMACQLIMDNYTTAPEICLCNSSIEGLNYNNVTYENRTEWLTKIKTSNPSSNPNYVIIGEQGCSMLELIGYLANQEIVFGLTFNLNNRGVLTDESGVVHDSKLYINGTPHGLQLNNEYLALMDCDCFSLGDFELRVRPWYIGYNVKVVTIQLVTERPKIMMLQDQLFEIPVPVLNNLGLMGKWEWLNLRKKKVRMIPKLMKALCMRNINGTLSVQELIEIAEMYARQVRTNRGLIIDNKEVTHEEVLMHVYTSKAYMMSENAVTFASTKLYDVAAWLGPLRRLIPTDALKPKEFIINLITMFNKDFDPNAMHYEAEELLTALKITDYKKMWDKLLELNNTGTLRTVRRGNMHDINTKPLYRQKICPHQHETNKVINTIGKNCKCCGLLTGDLDKNYCQICEGHDHKSLKDPIITWHSKPKKKDKNSIKNIINVAKQETKPEDQKPNDNDSVQDENTDSDSEVSSTLSEKKVKEAKGKISYLKMLSVNEDEAYFDEDTKKNLLRPIKSLSIGRAEFMYKLNGYYTASKDVIKICDYEDKSVTDGKCVFETLQSLVPELTDTYISIITNKQSYLTIEDVMKVARTERLNIIMLNKHIIHFMMFSDSNNCVTISDSASIGIDNENHCYAVSIESVDKLPLLLTTIPNKSKEDVDQAYASLNIHNDDELADETDRWYLHAVRLTNIALTKTPKPSPGLGCIVNEGFRFVWSSSKDNNTHNINNAQFYCSIEMERNKVLQEFIDSMTIRPKELIRNKEKGLASSLDEMVKQDIRSCACAMNDIFNAHIRVEQQSMVSNYTEVRVEPSYLGYWTDVPKEGIKTYDVVYLKHFGKGAKMVTQGFVKQIRGNKMQVDTLGQKVPSVGKIALNKVSTGSIVRRVMMLVNATANRSLLLKTFEKCNVLVGPPGCGKSTDISNNIKEGDIAIAMTRGAVNRLKNLCAHNNTRCTIVTAEKFLTERKLTSEKVNIFIDEATMLDEYLLIKTFEYKVENIYIYGDPLQIGNIDVSNDPGLRYEQSLIDLCHLYCKPENITQTNTSYRLSKQVTEQLKELGVDIKSANNESTGSIDIINVSSLDEASDYCNSIKPDLIMCMYNETKNMLINSVTQPIQTAHRAQGDEVGNAVLILKATRSGSWGLNGRSTYLISALTRARNNTYIIIVGKPNLTKLEDVCHTRLGAKEEKNKPRKNIVKRMIKSLNKKAKKEVDQMPSISSSEVESSDNTDSEEVFDVSEMERKMATTLKINKQLAKQVTDENSMATFLLDTMERGGGVHCEVIMDVYRTLFVRKDHRTIKVSVDTGSPIKIKITIDTITKETKIKTAPPIIPFSILRKHIFSGIRTLGSDPSLKNLMEEQTNEVMKQKKIETLSTIKEIVGDESTDWKPDKELPFQMLDSNWYVSTKLRVLNYILDSSAKRRITVLTTAGKLIMKKNKNCPVMANITINLDGSTLEYWNYMPAQSSIILRGPNSMMLYDWIANDKHIDVFGEMTNTTLNFVLLYIERMRALRYSMASDNYKDFELDGDDLWMVCKHRVRVYSDDEGNLNMQYKEDLKETKLGVGAPALNKAYSEINSDLIYSAGLTVLLNCFGTLEEIELNISLNEHIKHNTEVAGLIAKQKAKDMRMTAMKTSSALWIPKINDALYLQIKNSLPNANIVRMSRRTTRYEYLTIIESISCWSLLSNFTKDRLLIYSSYTPQVCANLNMHYVMFKRPKPSIVGQLFDVNMVQAFNGYREFYNSKNNQLASVKQITKENSEVINAVVNLGLSLHDYDPSDLINLLNANNEVYGLVLDDLTSYGTNYDHVRSKLWIEGVDESIPYNLKYHENARTGRPLEYDLCLMPVYRNLNSQLVRVIIKKPDICRINSLMLMPNCVTVTKPRINNVVINLLKGESLIFAEKVQIDLRMYRSVMLRAISSSCDQSKIAAHVRSIALTEVTTESYIGLDKHIDPKVAVNTIQICQIHASSMINQFKVYKELLELAERNKFKEAMISQFLGLVANLSNILSEVLDFTKEAVANVVKQSDWNWLENMISEQSDLEMWVNGSATKFIDWRAKQNKVDESVDDDDDGDNDSNQGNGDEPSSRKGSDKSVKSNYSRGEKNDDSTAGGSDGSQSSMSSNSKKSGKSGSSSSTTFYSARSEESSQLNKIEEAEEDDSVGTIYSESNIIEDDDNSVMVVELYPNYSLTIENTVKTITLSEIHDLAPLLQIDNMIAKNDKVDQLFSEIVININNQVLENNIQHVVLSDELMAISKAVLCKNVTVVLRTPVTFEALNSAAVKNLGTKLSFWNISILPVSQIGKTLTNIAQDRFNCSNRDSSLKWHHDKNSTINAPVLINKLYSRLHDSELIVSSVNANKVIQNYNDDYELSVDTDSVFLNEDITQLITTFLTKGKVQLIGEGNASWTDFDLNSDYLEANFENILSPVKSKILISNNFNVNWNFSKTTEIYTQMRFVKGHSLKELTGKNKNYMDVDSLMTNVDKTLEIKKDDLAEMPTNLTYHEVQKSILITTAEFKNVKVTQILGEKYCVRESLRHYDYPLDFDYMDDRYDIIEILNMILSCKQSCWIVIRKTEEDTEINTGLCVKVLDKEPTHAFCLTFGKSVGHCEPCDCLAKNLNELANINDFINQSGIDSEIPLDAIRTLKMTDKQVSLKIAKQQGKRLDDDARKATLFVSTFSTQEQWQVLHLSNQLTREPKLIWTQHKNGNFELLKGVPFLDKDEHRILLNAREDITGVFMMLTSVITEKLTSKIVTESDNSIVNSFEDMEQWDKLGKQMTLRKDGMKGHVYLINYDNRSHHMVEDLDEAITEGRITASVHEPERGRKIAIDLVTLMGTMNNALNRQVIVDGKIKFLSEFDNRNTAKLIGLLENIEISQNNLISEEPMDISMYNLKMTNNSLFVQFYTIKPVEEMHIEGKITGEILNDYCKQKKWKWLNHKDKRLDKIIDMVVKIEMVNSGAQVISDGKDNFLVLADGEIFEEQKEELGQKTIYPIDTKTKHTDWWNLLKPESTPVKEDLDVNFMSYAAKPDRENWVIHNIEGNPFITERWDTIEEFEGTQLKYYMGPEFTSRHELILDNYDFWKTEDLSYFQKKYGPLTGGRLKTKEQFHRYSELIKESLTPLPARSRPVDTKSMFKTHNTITGRLMSVLKLRKMTPNPHTVLSTMSQAYFHNNASNMCNNFMLEPITFNTKLTIDWISKHHNTEKVALDLKNFLMAGTTNSSISDINIHLKLESLLKDKVIRTFLEQQPRSIMWQNYFVSAIFSPIFKEVKRRLKMLFSKKIIYADGCTPAQIQSMLKTKNNVNHMFENDLAKQDRQTDDPIIKIELSMYKALGVHDDVLKIWQTVHEIWRFKSKTDWGFCQSMRTTGQATTSLGNAITNLQCHAEFVNENQHIMQYFMVTGDDNNQGFTEHPDCKNLGANIKVKYNMQSEIKQSRTSSAFCCFLTTIREGSPSLVPNLTRLRHRFEVPNGVSELDDVNNEMRKMSYAMMLGALPRVTKIIKERNWPIKPELWYNYEEALSATADYYDSSIEEVENDVSLLLDMMESNEIFVHKWMIVKSKRI